MDIETGKKFVREKVTNYDYDKYKQYKFILNNYKKKYKWI